MTEDARLGRELSGNGGPLLRERLPFGRRNRGAPVRLKKVPDEKFELPGELLDVEGHAVGDVTIGGQLAPAALEDVDERDGLAVQRRVLGRARGAEMRLQGDVPQILKRHDALRVRVPENGRHRQRHQLQQLRHVGEGQRAEIDRTGVQREHDGLAVADQHAEVPPVGCVAGQLHDPGDTRREPALAKVSIDSLPKGGPSDRSSAIVVRRKRGCGQLTVWSAQEDRAPVRRSRRNPNAIGHDAFVQHRVIADLDVVPEDRARHRAEGAMRADEPIEPLPAGEKRPRRSPVVGHGPDVPETRVGHESRASDRTHPRSGDRRRRRSSWPAAHRECRANDLPN